MTAVALLVLAAVYFVFDPNVDGLFPRCGFFVLTGLKCPGCGSQRALHALLHGDVVGAFRLNMWIPVAAVYIGAVVVSLLFFSRESRFSRGVSNKYFFAAFLVFTLVWLVLRNVVGV